jgi:hypothetical protein
MQATADRFMVFEPFVRGVWAERSRYEEDASRRRAFFFFFVVFPVRSNWTALNMERSLPSRLLVITTGFSFFTVML